MGRLSLLFCNDTGLVSRAVRGFTWSRWSHVAMIDGYGAVEALPGEGVTITETQDILMRSRAFELVDLPCRDPIAVRAAAASQFGKPYDWSAVLGIALRRDWRQDDAWFCSELVAWAFEAAGEPLFREGTLRRVTPEHLWMLAPAESSGSGPLASRTAGR